MEIEPFSDPIGTPQEGPALSLYMSPGELCAPEVWGHCRKCKRGARQMITPSDLLFSPPLTSHAGSPAGSTLQLLSWVLEIPFMTPSFQPRGLAPPIFLSCRDSRQISNSMSLPGIHGGYQADRPESEINSQMEVLSRKEFAWKYF